MKLSKLLESNIEQAELCLAIRSISDMLQTNVEKLSDVLIQDVPTIVDRIKAQFGIQYGENISTEITGVLQTALQSLQTAKSTVENTALRLSGDDTSDIEQTSQDTSQEPPEDNNVAASEASGPRTAPEGRNMKEGINIAFRLKNGKMFRKMFENHDKAERWIEMNEKSIKDLKVL